MYKARNRFLTYLLFTLLVFLFCPLHTYSQIHPLQDSTYLSSIQDSVTRYYRYHPWKKKQKKERDYQILPYYGLNYSQETQFSASLGGIFLYKDKQDKVAPYSVVGLIASISNTLSYSGSIFGAQNFSHGQVALKYKVAFNHMPRRFWGLGYENASQDSNKGKYTEQRAIASLGVNYNFRHCSVGATLGYRYYRTFKFSDTTFTDTHTSTSMSPNIGLHFILDTKNDRSSPDKGIYLSVDQTFFPSILSDRKAYYRSALTFDFYQKAWWGSVFALDIFAETNYGDTPWTEFYQMGGDIRMRGYYLGRYRDRNIVTAQLELRQQIYKGHSVVIWGGAGNIFPAFSAFNIKNTLPTYGAGYRFKFYSLVLRADFGFGLNGQYSISVGINEAF